MSRFAKCKNVKYTQSFVNDHSKIFQKMSYTDSLKKRRLLYITLYTLKWHFIDWLRYNEIHSPGKGHRKRILLEFNQFQPQIGISSFWIQVMKGQGYSKDPRPRPLPQHRHRHLRELRQQHQQPLEV